MEKQFQLADWRERPLSEQMKRYARLDTHYLLYIFDRMVSELLSNGMKTEAPTEEGKAKLLSVLQKLRKSAVLKWTASRGLATE